MKDFDLENLNGSLNIEHRTDGGIGIYYETSAPHNTMMISKNDLMKVMTWLAAYVSEYESKDIKPIETNKRYCSRCDALFIAGHKCTAPLKGQHGKFNTEPKEYSDELIRQYGQASPEIVGIKDNRSVQVKQNEIEHNKVWNAAIEASAKIADEADEIAASDIRKLKK